jgi:tetratricopeptide (TPR) repeat protein
LLSALGRYQDAARIPGATLPVSIRVGQTYLRRGQPQEAVRSIQQVGGAYSSDRDLLLLLAEAQHQSLDAVGSLTTLRRLLDRRPDDLEVWCRLVEQSARAGLSLRDVGIPVGSDPTSSGDPRLDQRVAYLLGASLGGEQPDGGDAALRRATLGPNPALAASATDLLAATDGSADPAGRAIGEARELLGQGYVGPAMERLRSVPEADHAGAEAQALMGYAEMSLGRMDAAAEALRKSMGAAPDGELAQFVQGLLLRKRGDTEGAALLFRSVIGKGPANPGVDLEMADALADLGDYDGAEMLLRRAVGAAPVDPVLRLAVARFYVDRQYRAEEGLAQATEAVRLAPASALALETLGWAQQLTGQSQKAVATLLRAAAMDPESPRLRYRLGSVYEGLGERERAREEYDMVRELDGVGDQWNRAQSALDGLDTVTR